MVDLTYTGPHPVEQPTLRLSWEPGQTRSVPAAVAATLQEEYPGLYHEALPPAQPADHDAVVVEQVPAPVPGEEHEG